MSKILLLTPDAPPKRGGVARYIGATIRSCSNATLDVLGERQGALRILRHLVRVYGGYDMIWTHHIVPVGTACYLFSFLKKTSYTVFLHGLDFDLVRRNVWKRFLARRILARAWRIVTNSEALREEVQSFVCRDDVRVVYPCVSFDFVKASETVSKNTSDTSDRPVRLLTVARLVERKGHAKVLRAMKDLPNVTYTIVGDGPMRDALQKEAGDFGVVDRVTFLAAITDEQLPEIYASHDIFVMPTTKSTCDREGFGIVYAEAGLFGLPCIATDIPGVDEAIVHEVTGLLIADTPLALHEAMKKLAESPGLRSRMGSAARARIFERFTEKQFTEQLQRLA